MTVQLYTRPAGERPGEGGVDATGRRSSPLGSKARRFRRRASRAGTGDSRLSPESPQRPLEGAPTLRVLVVDDDAEITRMLERMLSASGHAVTTRSRGSEALLAALHEDYDLLICDLMLPDLEGIEVVRAIKSQTPNLPVIVISALEQSEWEQACMDAGAACYLQKPVRLEALRREVELVEKARANLRVALIDPDPIHRTRVTRALSGLGCEVLAFGEGREALEVLGGEGRLPSLLLVDASDPGAALALKLARTQQVASFAFGSVSADEEERLMREGAALLLPKPVDCDALIIQARFLANG